MKARTAGLLAAAALAAAAPLPEEQRARDAIRGLGQLLQQMLGEELKRGGVEGAVRMCSENAQVVTEEFAREQGLEIRRVSTRYRNPKNRPDEFEARVLAAWAKSGKPATHIEKVKEGGKDWLRLMEPIRLQAMCVNCHGAEAQLTAEVKTLLAERYPRDHATGFKPGDLRGAFSVVVPLAPAR
jgi:hypothetical protein